MLQPQKQGGNTCFCSVLSLHRLYKVEECHCHPPKTKNKEPEGDVVEEREGPQEEEGDGGEEKWNNRTNKQNKEFPLLQPLLPEGAPKKTSVLQLEGAGTWERRSTRTAIPKRPPAQDNDEGWNIRDDSGSGGREGGGRGSKSKLITLCWNKVKPAAQEAARQSNGSANGWPETNEDEGKQEREKCRWRQSYWETQLNW